MPPSTACDRSSGVPWTIEEEQALKREFATDTPIKDIAARHERSRGAIRSRLIHFELIEPPTACEPPGPDTA